jgi:hypothetical protein
MTFGIALYIFGFRTGGWAEKAGGKLPGLRGGGEILIAFGMECVIFYNLIMKP